MELEKRKRKRLDLTTINNTATRKVDSASILQKDRTLPSSKSPPPSEEEVEEFFTIIRHMKIMVKTLQDSGCEKGNAAADSSVFQKRTAPLRTELLQQISRDGNGTGDISRRRPVKEVIDDQCNETTAVERNTDVAVINGVRWLDLNSVPTEAETSSIV